MIQGGGGQDLIFANGLGGQVFADSQTDLASAIAAATTTSASGQQGSILSEWDVNSTLVGGTGNDLFVVGQGSDVIVAGPGNDTFLGGEYIEGTEWQSDQPYLLPGTATLVYPSPTGNIQADPNWSATTTYSGGFQMQTNYSNIAFWNPLQHFGFAGGDAPANYAQLTANGYDAGVGDDTIYGGSGNSVFYLSNGNNYVDAGTGNDYIYAGNGDNTIFGGTGRADCVAYGADV